LDSIGQQLRLNPTNSIYVKSHVNTLPVLLTWWWRQEITPQCITCPAHLVMETGSEH